MTKKQIIVLWVLLIVLIPIIAIFTVVVWPTKYKYLPYEGDKPYLALRINRFTGEAEGLHPYVGWRKFQRKKEAEMNYDRLREAGFSEEEIQRHKLKEAGFKDKEIAGYFSDDNVPMANK
jgi:hypothetical protein